MTSGDGRVVLFASVELNRMARDLDDAPNIAGWLETIFEGTPTRNTARCGK